MHEYEKFLKQFRVKRYKKGEIILVQGETPDCGYVVKKGVVKTYNLTSQGEEKPIGFDLDFEIFPLGWVFGKASRVQYYYEAFTEAEVYCVPVSEYTHFLETHPSYAQAEISHFVSRFISMQLRINALEQSKASLKVINTIHFLCLRFGQAVSKNVIRIQLPLTQQDLANFIGLTRETTGIELKRLHSQGVLSYKKQNYIVRKDKLDQLLDEDYGLGIVELGL